MTNRFQPIADAEMSADQRRFAEESANKSGPYAIYQRNPELWRAMQPPRTYFGGDCAIPPALRELAILVAGHFWQSDFAVESHVALARKAGLPDAVIAEVVAGREPTGTAEHQAIYRFSRAQLTTGRVGDDDFNAVCAHFGERGAIDLTAIVGYYSYVSLLLNLDRRSDEAENRKENVA